jgi:hypothetical protein
MRLQDSTFMRLLLFNPEGHEPSFSGGDGGSGSHGEAVEAVGRGKFRRMDYLCGARLWECSSVTSRCRKFPVRENARIRSQRSCSNVCIDLFSGNESMKKVLVVGLLPRCGFSGLVPHPVPKMPPPLLRPYAPPAVSVESAKIEVRELQRTVEAIDAGSNESTRC